MSLGSPWLEVSQYFLNAMARMDVAMTKDPTKKTDAEQKARALLLAHMSEEQRKTFVIQSKFLVTSADRGWAYIVTANVNWGINRVHKCGKSYITFAAMCAFPDMSHGMPVEDGVLQIKLMFEAKGGEGRLLRAANVSFSRPPSCDHAECLQEYRLFRETVDQAGTGSYYIIAA